MPYIKKEIIDRVLDAADTKQVLDDFMELKYICMGGLK